MMQNNGSNDIICVFLENGPSLKEIVFQMFIDYLKKVEFCEIENRTLEIE